MIGSACLPAAAQVSVSSSGTPSYGQAIAVPPGISGMQPNLSLMYAGGGVNGPVGHGWSVQGISMISRCPATRYIDAVPRGVKFDQNDKLCLDGQRLIQTDASGTVSPAAVYDGNGKLTSFPQVDDARGLASGWREYRTEKDSFARIRAYGVANGSDVNGPAYFKVWTKAGQLYEYGAPASADANTKAAITAQGQNIVMVWAVARVSDVVGNYIDFKYEVRDVAWGSGPTVGSPTAGREWNVAEVQYTGNGAQAPTNKVVFGYSDRAETRDRGEAYQRGSKNVSIRRLNTVDTYVNSPNSTTLGPAAGATLVKRTKLSYDNSSVTQRSRLASIKECTDAAETKCLPATTFNYANGGSEAFLPHSAFAASTLSTTQLRSSSGTVGVEVGDFNGDGRTDLLRWADSPANNRLYLNGGGGAFSEVPLGTGAGHFNITDTTIFSSSGCAASLLMDFNGDGLTDIFRYVSQDPDGGSCPAAPTYLYLSLGDGSFDRRTVTGVTLAKRRGYVLNCPLFDDSNCTHTQRETFYVFDVDGDGRPDIVRTLIPEHINSSPVSPDDAAVLCASTTCTRVYKGDGQGGFNEISGTLFVSNKALYQRPSGSSGSRALAQQRYVADVDGDGFADIVLGNTAPGGQTAWRSIGNGDFEIYTTPTDAEDCNYRGDFNGDGRGECLWPSSSATSNRLTLSTGTQLQRVNFNLSVSGGPGLVGSDKDTRVMDFNGDGRTDILRWHDWAGSTVLYLSNGDGSFTQSSSFNLGSIDANRLVTSGGSYDYVVGDFTGNGSLEILRLHASPSSGEGGTNQLYVKSDPTLPDQLLSVVSPTGIRTALTYDSLANAASGRYASDRGTANAATYPLVDLTIASPVVVTMETDVGVGLNKIQTQFAYKGLKAAMDGRGMLGFRQGVQQNTAPNGEALSIWTDYLFDEPYAGVARRTETRKGAWNAPNAQLLSWTTNTYCDRTSAANPPASDTTGLNDSFTDTAPCATNARIRRPYLRKSVEEGTDLDGTALPMVTTVSTYNDHGDPTAIVVTTTGAMAGLANQTFTKSTANTFCAADSGGCPNKISGDNWILGRLTRSTVTNTVPNLLASLNASPGNAANASATAGSLQPALALSDCSSVTPTTSPTAASMSCSLSNTGQAPVSSISYSSAANTSVGGPTGACAAGTTCGTVTVTTATGAGTYSGTLTATPSAGSAASQGISLQVRTPPALAFSGCTSNSPSISPIAATLSCTLSNSGQTAASSISYGTAANTSVSGPTGSCAAGATCGTVTVTTATSAATYSGTLTATPDSGSAASQGVNLVVNPPPTPPALALSGCSSNSPTTSPTAATMSCTLSNAGQTAVSSISYSTAANTSVSGPTGACAASSTCGTVTVTTATSAGTYSGTLTATPNSGSAASQGISLQVRTPPALALSGCSSTTPTTAPTAATMSCTVSNGGQTAANSISYGTAAGTSVSGPTGACGAGATCGTVTVTTGTSAATYSGTLTATPNSGSAASQAISLQVRTPPALALSGCSSTTPTTSPTAATMSCTVSNSGQTAASSISYSTAANTSVSGPTGACGGGATCGTVTVTTANSAGTYSGTLTATPNTGSAASQGIGLQVNTPPALALTSCSGTTPTASPTAATMSCTLSNTGQTATSSISYGTAASTTVSGPTGACGAGATCGTVTVTTATSAGTYSGMLTATPNSGSAASQAVNLVVYTPTLFTYVSKSASSSGNTFYITFTFRNDNATGVQVTGRGLVWDPSYYGSASVYGGTCASGASLAAAATCTVVISAVPQQCYSYTVRATLSNTAGTRQGAVHTVAGTTGPECW